MSFHVPNKYRVRRGDYASSEENGNNGKFFIPESASMNMPLLQIIASDGEGWEHVSVSSWRTPSWREMCFVKSLFWDDEDVVVQFHPRASEYVNNHPHCLHLWRPTDQQIPNPPSILVGVLT